jgi:hypothetical protein
MIGDRFHFKANEFRTILYYLSFGLFRGLLDDEVLKLLVTYAVFIRLLCQEKILKQDIMDAKEIIDEFIYDFEKIYGAQNMLSNLHRHIHIPQQVLDFGPYNVTKANRFEKMFQVTRDKFHGTRAFEKQISLSFERSKVIKKTLINALKESKNSNFKNFVKTHMYNSRFEKKENCLLKPKEKNLNSLKSHEIYLFKKIDSNVYRLNQKILVSDRALINSKEFHSLAYDNNFEALNCHTIEFKTKNEDFLYYGIIENFFNLSGKGFCLVKKFSLNPRDTFFSKLNKLVLNHIDKFFLLVTMTDEYELVEWDLITRRCILMNYTNNGKKEIMLSPCNDLSECD